MKLMCNSCHTQHVPNVIQSGPGWRADCSACGTYIKFLNKNELKTYEKYLQTTQKPEMVSSLQSSIVAYIHLVKEYRKETEPSMKDFLAQSLEIYESRLLNLVHEKENQKCQ